MAISSFSASSRCSALDCTSGSRRRGGCNLKKRRASRPSPYDLRWNQSRSGKENFRWSYDFMPLRREGTAARGWQLLDSGEGRMGNPPTVRGLASADRARLHSRRGRQLVGPDGHRFESPPLHQEVAANPQAQGLVEHSEAIEPIGETKCWVTRRSPPGH